MVLSVYIRLSVSSFRPKNLATPGASQRGEANSGFLFTRFPLSLGLTSHFFFLSCAYSTWTFKVHCLTFSTGLPPWRVRPISDCPPWQATQGTCPSLGHAPLRENPRDFPPQVLPPTRADTPSALKIWPSSSILACWGRALGTCYFTGFFSLASSDRHPRGLTKSIALHSVSLEATGLPPYVLDHSGLVRHWVAIQSFRRLGGRYASSYCTWWTNPRSFMSNGPPLPCLARRPWTPLCVRPSS